MIERARFKTGFFSSSTSNFKSCSFNSSRVSLASDNSSDTSPTGSSAVSVPSPDKVSGFAGISILLGMVTSVGESALVSACNACSSLRHKASISMSVVSPATATSTSVLMTSRPSKRRLRAIIPKTYLNVFFKNPLQMRRECDEIWFYVKKTRFNTGLEQGTNTLATFRSTTELLPLIKKHYKTTIFYKQEFEKSSEFRMNCSIILKSKPLISKI